jgi:hypothetical protein
VVVENDGCDDDMCVAARRVLSVFFAFCLVVVVVEVDVRLHTVSPASPASPAPEEKSGLQSPGPSMIKYYDYLRVSDGPPNPGKEGCISAPVGQPVFGSAPGCWSHEGVTFKRTLLRIYCSLCRPRGRQYLQ